VGPLPDAHLEDGIMLRLKSKLCRGPEGVGDSNIGRWYSEDEERVRR
jgi:hypothetical protein